MSGLTWLHLSDWHHKDFRTDPKVVRDRLVKDIEERTAISPDLDKIDFIVFSGDAASGGRAEEYKEAKKEFFDYILEAARVSPRRLFIVPGNHDLDETEIKRLPDDFQKDTVSKEDVDFWLTDATKREQLLRPFKDFKSFVVDYTGQDSPDYSNARTWKIEGKIVSLLGINSAWWCRRHKDAAGKPNDYGFAMVGELQIHELLDRISESDLRIAVLHHSQDWLEYSDGERVWSRLRHECDFILHGHGHKPKVTAEHGTGGDCVIIPAGASFERRIAKDPSHVNSYNFVHLEPETGKGTVFLRRWIDERTEWARDDQTYPDGKFPIDLPGYMPVPSGPSVPHQIRPPPRDFAGRDKEIGDLLHGFEHGDVIAGLRGMGGVGKTALALVLAERLAGRYLDGQILVEMKGTDKRPLSAAEAMILVIRAYDPEFKMPLNENELAGIYYSILHGKKALLLLDNAASREQVEPLLPPKGCALLVTSRHKFALPGLLQEMDLVLGTLPQEDANKLLMEISRRIGEHAGELAELCGYLPLALRNAAYALKERPNLSVADYIKRLGESRKRMELVEASFTSSYELLTPELQSLWCLLSVFPADFDLVGAAAVWELERTLAEDALGELVKWSLVDFVPFSTSEGGRYRLHDLVRVFAVSRLDANVLDLVQQRHAEHYRMVLSVADQIFNQGNENYLEGLKLFDNEWANILAGQSWAEKNLANNSIAEELCKTYPEAGANVLDLRLIPQQKISWLEKGLEAARGLSDRNTEGNHLGNLGLAYSALGDARKAIEYHEQALTIAQEIKNRRNEGIHLGNLGLAYSALGDARKAIEYHEQALTIAREIKDRRNEGTNLGNLGLNFALQGDVRKAIKYHKQHMAIAHDIGDRRGERDSLGNLGNAYAEMDSNSEAIKYYERALAIDRKIGDRQSEGSDLGNLGVACKNLGDPRKAIEYHEQHLTIARDIGDRRGEGNALGNLGNAHYILGDMQKALGYYKQVLAIERMIGDKREEGKALGNLGAAYHQMGYTRDALDCYEQHLIIAREIGDRMGEGCTLFNMSVCLDDLRQRSEAVKRAISALAIFEQMESPRAKVAREQLAKWLR